MQVSPRMKKIGTTIIVIISILEVIFGVLLISTIGYIQAPEATVILQVLNITTDNIVLREAKISLLSRKMFTVLSLECTRLVFT